TLVPAVVSLIGPKVFWPSKNWKSQPKGTAFQRIGGVVGRKPAMTAIVSGGIMIALALGVLGFKADYDQIGQLPSNNGSARALKDMQSAFPAGTLNPTEVYVQSTSGAPLDRAAVERFALGLKDADGVGDLQAAQKATENSPVQYAKFNGDSTAAEIKLVLH